MTTAPATIPAITASSAGPLVRSGLAAVAAASAATTAVAAIGGFVGVSRAVGGESIPLLGFATLTAAFSLVGLLLAVALRRSLRRARTTFVRITVVLTALSLVPDAVADASAGTKALLMLTHLVAAALVIPALARRLPD